MYAQLGNIIFEGLKGFTNQKFDYKTQYAEHKRVKDKPRLEKIGEQLDTLNFGMRLHQSFINPETAFNELNNARKNGDVLPLILGNGEFVNDFIILGISRDNGFTADDGSVILMNLSVSLKEHVNPDETEFERNELVQNSINSNPVNITEEKDQDFSSKSESTQAIKEIYEAENQSKIITGVITEYEAYNERKERAERKISPALDKMEAAYNTVDDLLATSEDLYQKAVNLPYAISVAKNNINAMKAALPINSPAEIRSNNDSLLSSVSNVRTSAGGIFSSNATRGI